MTAQDLPVRAKADAAPNGGPVKFGRALREEHFLFDPSYHNLNHGSFGTIPRAIQAAQRAYQDRAEATPDPFIRYEYPELLDVSRAAVASLLRVPTETVVFVPNATVGVNTVLRNLSWNPAGTDEILYFDTVYSGCAKTVDYILESRSSSALSARCIPLDYPCTDADILSAFTVAVQASRAAGRTPAVCLFDVVSSLPGVRFPFEAITAACRKEGILSLVDGAQGIGMVDLDLGAADPDFFVSNCHKWLHVPRGCAVFYVPLRNQALIRSSVPTSHGFVPKVAGDAPLLNKLAPRGNKSEFVRGFEFVGTLDNAPYLCVKDSIKWREEVLGGEERIIRELMELARAGGKIVAEKLGTRVLDNEEQTLTRCSMVNVALPLVVGEGEGTVIPVEDEGVVTSWILDTLMDEYKTFVALFMYKGQWWARLSAQVYLELADFEWAAETLKAVCDRVAKGEYKK